MGLVCLLGRHGCGKSTIGLALQKNNGYQHLSVGLLRRLANEGKFPSDVPVSLVTAMKKARPGQPLPTPLAQKLINFATSLPNCVIDGFPVIQEHFILLPPETQYFYIWTPKLMRSDRLEIRSSSSKRIWTPGGHSERELKLPALLHHIRRNGRLHFISNAKQGIDNANDIAIKVCTNL